MTIRKPISEDKEQLIQLLIEFNQETRDFIPEGVMPFAEYKDVTNAATEKADKILSDTHGMCFVAEEGDKLLGFITGEVQEKPYRKMDKTGYIENWFVSKNSQGNHVGKALFEKITEEFRILGCQSLTLDTYIGNTRAIEIYHHMGFYDRALLLVRKI